LPYEAILRVRALPVKESTVIDIRRLGTAAMFLILLAAGPARAAPEVGWWWNPNESGRGFFVESQNGIIYLAGYFYEADGRATWLVSGGPNTDSYNYQGRLLAYSNGQTLTGDYKPPSTPTDAGPVSISFSDDTHGTIVWPGGTIPIVRQTFGAGPDAVGPGPEAFTPENGWWWNEAESGRGYSFEVQGDKLFVVAFMYDAAGNPVWYYSTGTMTTPTTYAGPWLQFAGGQTLTGAYRPPGTPAVVGQLGIEFTAVDQATLTLNTPTATEPPGGLQKKSNIFTVKRQFKKPKLPRPKGWIGEFVIEDKLVNIRKPSSVPGVTAITTWKWTAQNIELGLGELVDLPVNPWTYYVKRGVVVSQPAYFQISSDNKEMCEQKPGQNSVESLAGDAVKVVVSVPGESWGDIDLQLPTFTLLLTCMIDGKPLNHEVLLPNSLNFSLSRKFIDAGVIEGRIADAVVLELDRGLESIKRTVSARWSFLPAK